MEAPANSATARHIRRAILLCAVGLAAAGCLPDSKTESKKTDNDAFAASTAKSSPLSRNDGGLQIYTQPAQTLTSGRGAAGSADGEAQLYAAAAPSPSAQDDPPPSIPTIEDIPEVPANVALAHFFSSLAKLEKGGVQTVTILHLGDSHIAADRFSGGLRDQFQSRFGDAGRGMLTPGLYLARGVKFDRGGEWQTALSHGGVPGPYGITGAKLTAQSKDAWLRMTAQDTAFAWCEITVDSGPQAGTLLMSLDGEMKQAPMHAAAQTWRNIRLERPARELLIRPKGDGLVTIHSISIGTDKPGVRYVNLGLPGATAQAALSWDRNYIAGDLKRIGPDLIILSYGTVESLDDTLDLNTYETKASAAIARLRQAAPQASFMIVGPPDISIMPKFASGSGKASDVCRALSPAERANYARRIKKRDPRLARWHPPYNFEAVRATLRRLAAAHNALFWDWSKLMGGPCGIHAWVHSKPPLAANDHIHLTEEGSKRSARLLFRELMTAYDAASRTAAAVAK
jgi:lysophospholipase L1-like esterase